MEALESPRGAFYASCVRRLEFETGDDSERKALKILALYFPKMVNLDALFFGRFSDAARDVSLTGLLLRAARGLPIRTLVFEGCGNLPLAGVLAPCLKTLKSLETLSFPLNGVATENVDAALAQAIPSSVRDLTFAPNGSADNLTRILKRLDRLDTLILELPVWMPLKSYERLEQITGQLRRLQVGLVELSGSERGGPFDPPRDLISKITSTSLRLVRFNRFRFGEQATDLINLLSKNPSVELIIFDTCEFANDDLTLLCGAAAPQVKQLALHGCETLNVLPRALAKLQNLEVLSIAEDVLDGPVWEAIGNMDSLTALEILDSEFEVDHLKTALDKLTEKNLKELVLGPEAFFLKGALENAYGSLKVSITGSPTWDLDWFV